MNKRIASLKSVVETTALNSGTNKELTAKHEEFLKREISFGHISQENKNTGKSNQESERALYDQTEEHFYSSDNIRLESKVSQERVETPNQDNQRECDTPKHYQTVDANIMRS
jgi:heterodisulfide reductase subunit C